MPQIARYTQNAIKSFVFTILNLAGAGTLSRISNLITASLSTIPTDTYGDMEGYEAEVVGKRRRQSLPVEDKQIMVVDAEETVGEETETGVPLSEQMQLDIARIHEKMDSFTTLVSELMESGKSLLQEISNQFEERLISIHKEQVEKWQEEVRALRLLDASNEETNTLLHSARYILHNVHVDS